MEMPPLLSKRVLCLLLEAWVLLGETMVEKATVARVPLLRNVVKGMTAIRVVLREPGSDGEIRHDPK